MTSEQAAALSVGQQVKYWDGRMADVQAQDPTNEEVTVNFDPTKETVSRVKHWDMRMAEPYVGLMTAEEIVANNKAVILASMPYQPLRPFQPSTDQPPLPPDEPTFTAS